MRLFTLFACSAMTVLGGCILLYNPDSYRFSDKGGSGGGGSNTVSASSGTGGQAVCTDGGAPSPELCGNDIDEDCDGKACKNSSTWSYRYQDPGSPQGQRTISGLALSDTGHIAIAGWYDGTFEIDPGHSASDTTPSGHNLFAARLDEMGAPDWLDASNDATNREAYAVAMSADGDTVAYTGMAQNASQEALVVYGHPSKWQLSLPGQNTFGTAIALDKAGAVFVALGVLNSTGTLNCAQTGPLKYDTTKSGVIIAKLEPAGGACLWGQFYEAESVNVSGLAVDPLGRPVVALNYMGLLTGNVIVNPSPAKGRSAVVFSLTGDTGTLRWSREIAAQKVTLSSVAIGSSNRVYVSGSFQGTTDTTPPLTASGEDLLVMALNGGDIGSPGAIVWAERFGGAGIPSDMPLRKGTSIAAVRANGEDSLYVAGPATASLSLRPNTDDDTMCKGGGIFLLELRGQDGGTVWGDCFGVGSWISSGAVRMAANATGIVLAGSRIDTIDFGNGPLEGTTLDAFLAHFPLQ